MKYSYTDTSAEDRAKWEKLCPVGSYRVVAPTEASGYLPAGLLAKCDSVFVLASGSPDGTAVWMANAIRVDAKDSAIDQNPLGIVFHGNTPALSGTLVQHGDWPGRSIQPPQQFWDAVKASGIGNVFPFSGLPSNHSGLITDLQPSSQQEAFAKTINGLKGSIETGPISSRSMSSGQIHSGNPRP